MEQRVSKGIGGEELQSIFVGSFTHSLDPKRRLTIPAEWRDQVEAAGSLYVLPGIHERCLYVFPAREMTRRIERIKNHSVADAKARLFTRAIASRSDLVTWDTQGRIRIKDELLNYAELKDQVVLVGAFEKFELWAPALWQSVSTALDQSTMDDAARYVGF